MMLAECVDHVGIDVVDGDAQDKNCKIPPKSCKKPVLVIHSSSYIAVHRCEIHVCS